jgi:cellulose synthase/poly-beta-1,6-N-acetylglucosamine synthase-like glycosyltransferase
VSAIELSVSPGHGPVVWIFCGLYLLVLGVLSVYGFHRSYLVVKCAQLRDRLRAMKSPPPPLAVARNGANGIAEAGGASAALPLVTIQLPLYNEANVAARLLDHVAAIEYPRDRLEVQVLDDSTDETSELLAPIIARLRANGLDIVHLRRTDRAGYKAGALDAGLKVAKGELIAMFDADFLPAPDFLARVVPHFADPRIGMVQGRWTYLNRDESFYTRAGALMLDGHHVVENRVRAAAGWMFNFAGTGGIWRRKAIEEGGGWQHDTLTEDLDLSYRAQLAGWKFVYREDVAIPSELPDDVLAFRVQQFRWAKGTVQTRRKLLGSLLRAPIPFGAKAEAFFHLTPHIAYPLTMLLSVLLLPVVLVTSHFSFWTLLLLDLPLFLGTTGSLAAFYALSQSHQGRRAWDGIKDVPAVLVSGVGLTPLLTRALVEGQRSVAGEFVRTPKKGSMGAKRYAVGSAPFPRAELLLGAVSSASVVGCLLCHHYFALPFALMFAVGYLRMAVSLLRVRTHRPTADIAPAVTVEPPPAALPSAAPRRRHPADTDSPRLPAA